LNAFGSSRGRHHPAVREHTVDVHHENLIFRARATTARVGIATRREKRATARTRPPSPPARPQRDHDGGENQNGSMIRTMMKVLAPSAWPGRPMVPATKPSAAHDPRGWSGSARDDAGLQHCPDERQKRRGRRCPLRKVRANCWSMNAKPVTP
jgi:hypothetical protein